MNPLLGTISAEVVEVAPAYDHAEITSLAATTMAYERVNVLDPPTTADNAVSESK